MSVCDDGGSTLCPTADRTHAQCESGRWAKMTSFPTKLDRSVEDTNTASWNLVMEKSVSPGGCSEEKAGPTDVRERTRARGSSGEGLPRGRPCRAGGHGPGWCERGAGDLLC